MTTKSMKAAHGAKSAYQMSRSDRGHDLTEREVQKSTGKMKGRGVTDAEKKFAADKMGDDKMTRAGRNEFRKFLAEDNKPNTDTKARDRFAAKVSSHMRERSELGKTLSLAEVRAELAELKKSGLTADDVAYARATYKGKKLSPAARAAVNALNKD